MGGLGGGRRSYATCGLKGIEDFFRIPEIQVSGRDSIRTFFYLVSGNTLKEERMGKVAR